MAKDTYSVTNEGDGIIRVDADIRLVRKPLAVAMCDDVDRAVTGLDEFRILMNMSAMSKGTPAAGFFVLRTMKKYPLRAIAFFGANGFMRGMATTVLGLAGFSNFEMFDDETDARAWLEQPDPQPIRPAGSRSDGSLGLRRFAVPATILSVGALVVGARKRRRN